MQMITGAASLALLGGWRLVKAVDPRRFLRARQAPWPGRVKTLDQEQISRIGPWNG